ISGLRRRINLRYIRPAAYIVLVCIKSCSRVAVIHLHGIPDKKIASVSCHSIRLDNISYAKVEHLVVNNRKVWIDTETKIIECFAVVRGKLPSRITKASGIGL